MSKLVESSSLPPPIPSSTSFPYSTSISSPALAFSYSSSSTSGLPPTRTASATPRSTSIDVDVDGIPADGYGSNGRGRERGLSMVSERTNPIVGNGGGGGGVTPLIGTIQNGATNGTTPIPENQNANGGPSRSVTAPPMDENSAAAGTANGSSGMQVRRPVITVDYERIMAESRKRSRMKGRTKEEEDITAQTAAR